MLLFEDENYDADEILAEDEEVMLEEEEEEEDSREELDFNRGGGERYCEIVSDIGGDEDLWE